MACRRVLVLSGLRPRLLGTGDRAMKEKWWIVDDGVELNIVSSGVEPLHARRGPFEFYLEAEEWADRWERKQRAREDTAYLVMLGWALFAVIGFFWWVFV